VRRIEWRGWLIAVVLILSNAAAGLPASAGASPVDGHMLASLRSAEVASSQELPPGPTQRMRTEFRPTDPPGQVELVQLVLEFAAGAFTPSHTHGGEGFVTLLEGEQTVRDQAGQDQRFQAGGSFVERPGEFLVVGNTGSTRSRVLVTFLLPEGAPLTTTRQGMVTGQVPPGPTTAAQFRMQLPDLPAAPYDVIHLLLDFAPGAFTPAHTHGGVGVVTVLSGEMTVRHQDGQEQRFQTGESFVESPGEFLVVGNSTQTVASVGVVFLLPEGAPLTTVAAGPGSAPIQVPSALPRTGEAAAPMEALAILGIALVLAGAVLRRRTHL
jgi:LPXTG-motif cell wall-anchored protein